MEFACKRYGTVCEVSLSADVPFRPVSICYSTSLTILRELVVAELVTSRSQQRRVTRELEQ